MMYAYSGSGWGILGLHLHWVFWGLVSFGFIAGLLWLYKHASKKDFLTVVWTTLLLGILGALLTSGLAMRGWSDMWGMMEGRDGYSYTDWDEEDRETMWEEMEEHMGWEGENGTEGESKE